ncbi:stomatal closure-related actin-binding protein 1 [Oryza brachyantha]|uniref:stomatal closure-related actin-binding protein 1 n=1 Tax=Oryza brachyantha TaxID=4533 RepID=UPI0003EABBB0|nr:stomatal closure-related actin-binding protein 1 [Oryza brachyantha]XP_015694904.1 stomatal closure-related actin-binding protein 1 [Oryza brachyantha]XP_040381966.1 stomatal closure-related actin-binding protein 1 [Oryza brachyantha]
MTRASTIDFGRKTQNDVLWSGPLRPANFIRNKFPTYKKSLNGIVVKLADDPVIPSLKEIVAKETEDLLDRRQRLSVRELAMKFEKGLNTATLLSNEVKWRQVALLERDILLKNLKNVLESLRSRVAGKHKDEIEESFSMVDVLAVQLSKREDELLQQKTEVAKIATSLKLASEDARRIVEEERSNARIEIDNARAAVQKVEQLVKEQEIDPQINEKQDEDELKEKAQEARRVKMLHCPSKAMDIENEIEVLREQLAEKSSNCVHLLKELHLHQRYKENDMSSYELEGLESLGSMLHLVAQSDGFVDLSKSRIQWFRVQPEGNKKEIISGAIKQAYAPDPHDVGWYLQAEINHCGQILVVKTAGPIDPAAGLVDCVETLLRNPETEYNVVVLQVNGIKQPTDSIHVLTIGKLRMWLAKGKTVIAKEFYSSSMQLCGMRGSGDAAPQAMYWQPRRDLSLVLGFETARERNCAIILARRFAIDCNIVLAGPGDKTRC